MTDLSKVPTHQLLGEIIKREGWVKSYAKEHSTTYYGNWVESLVSIDKDHTAQIRMPEEEYQVLCTLLGVDEL